MNVLLDATQVTSEMRAGQCGEESRSVRAASRHGGGGTTPKLERHGDVRCAADSGGELDELRDHVVHGTNRGRWEVLKGEGINDGSNLANHRWVGTDEVGVGGS